MNSYVFWNESLILVEVVWLATRSTYSFGWEYKPRSSLCRTLSIMHGLKRSWRSCSRRVSAGVKGTIVRRIHSPGSAISSNIGYRFEWEHYAYGKSCNRLTDFQNVGLWFLLHRLQKKTKKKQQQQHVGLASTHRPCTGNSTKRHRLHGSGLTIVRQPLQGMARTSAKRLEHTVVLI
jgi:hypothetical protein